MGSSSRAVGTPSRVERRPITVGFQGSVTIAAAEVATTWGRGASGTLGVGVRFSASATFLPFATLSSLINRTLARGAGGGGYRLPPSPVGDVGRLNLEREVGGLVDHRS